MKKLYAILAVLVMSTVLLNGCGKDEATGGNAETKITAKIEGSNGAEGNINKLTVTFGHEGLPFTLTLEENDTAKAISSLIGNGINLPIYHYNDYENWEVMQYYDIPKNYEIPSVPKHITRQKGGELYYEEPNKLVLFYRDAQVEGEYTLIGTFNYNDTFTEAVENNPVLEDWGNKIVCIRREGGAI